jgi:hypothetical protein
MVAILLSDISCLTFLDKLRVAYTIILRKPLLDGSDLLSGKEYSKRVEEQVKCMFAH